MSRAEKNSRRAEVRRETKETRIYLSVDLDDAKKRSITTGVGFFDHMLDAFACHGRFGLEVEAKGDLHIDAHHVVEDIGIVLGTALREALGADLRIRRFAHAYAPLDEALARAVIDISGRSFLGWELELSAARVGDFDTQLAEEFFRAFAANARLNLHVDLIRGRNAHHQIEAIFKSVALALRDATRHDGAGIPSTKGTLSEDRARAP